MSTASGAMLSQVQKKAQQLTARAKKQQQMVAMNQQKLDYQIVTGVLQSSPLALASTKRHLMDKGYITAEGYCDEDKILGEMPSDWVSPFKGKPEDKDSAKDDSEEAGNLQRTVHRNHVWWGGMPPVLLKMVLEHMEPGVMSCNALKILTKPGAKEPERDKMLQLLERCC